MAGAKGKKGGSIQSRLLLLLVFILIPILVLQAYTYYESFQSRRAIELKANLELARAVSTAFDSFILNVINQELAIGLAITSSQPMSSKDINRLLKSSRGNPAVRDFTWMNPGGEAIHSSNDDMIGRNYSDRSYFREVANGREWKVSELIFAKTTGEPVFGISRGIRDNKGVLLGIVFAAIIPERLDAILSFERSKDAGISLIDSKGIHVVRWPKTVYTWEQRNWLKHYPVIAEVLAGKEATSIVTSESTGAKRIVGFAPVSEIGWAVASSRAEQDVVAPIFSAIQAQGILFLITLSLAVFATMAIARPMVTSLKRLRDHALALGRGEVTAIGTISGPNELRDLSYAFNQMSEKIQSRESALRESEQLYRGIGESIDYGIWVCDPDGRNTYASKSFLDLVGVTQERYSNFGWGDVLHPDDAERTIAAWKECVRTGTLWDIEHRFRGVDGHWHFILARGVPVRNEQGEVICWAGINLDVNKLKKTEMSLKERTRQLEDANKELESFNFSVSHDLGAPLRAIKGYSQMILKKQGDRFDEETRRRFQVITENIGTMGRLIEDLLAFSRLGRQAVTKASINLEELIGEVWHELVTINPDRKMTLNICRMPAALGDRALIRQVYSNLLGNAVKFSREKAAAVIEAGSCVQGGEIVYFVRDSGIGFDMKFHDKLFGVFHRLHSADEYEGTGIGLALVQRIIHRHGGRVWAEGKEHEGATFFFTLSTRQE